LTITASAASLSPVSSTTPSIRPPAVETEATDALQRMSAPSRVATRASASASRYMPPSTYQTPSCSTCATSISVAGAAKGDEPQ
jgi:hypothetical protein